MTGRKRQVPFHNRQTLSRDRSKPTSRRAFVELIGDALPRDGCVLIFNVNRHDDNMIRQAISKLVPGVLTVHYCSRMSTRSEWQQNTRDLYITWRDDD